VSGSQIGSEKRISMRPSILSIAPSLNQGSRRFGRYQELEQAKGKALRWCRQERGRALSGLSSSLRTIGKVQPYQTDRVKFGERM